MQITKIFDIILNIDNINIIFSNNIESQILNLIEQKYLNKCYLESYIIKINKILNRSLIESNQNNLNCDFIVYIQFEAECIIYSQNEVILNMEIHENINNNIIAKNNYIVAMIKNNKDISFLKKGSKIPIIVGKAKFTTGSNKITINSYPFIPIINQSVIYYKINKITDDEKNQLNDSIIIYINIEEERKNKILEIKNNNWNYFNNLLYPYKNNKSDENIKKDKTIELLSYKYEDSIIYFNQEINLSEKLISINNDAKNYLEDSSFNILYNLFKKYYLYLKLVNDLSEEYNSKELIDKNMNLFELYIKYKK
jgi:hypothetical protein